jgi:hypothetical protein
VSQFIWKVPSLLILDLRLYAKKNTSIWSNFPVFPRIACKRIYSFH